MKISMSTGVTLQRSVQSPGSCRRVADKLCEPRFGITIQGKVKNRGSSITRVRFFPRSRGVHPTKGARGASFRAAVLKPGMAMSRPSHSYTASRIRAATKVL